MNILFHLGLHCTDDGLLIRSILQNRARLADQGIAVPGPVRYRELIGEFSTSLRGDPADSDTEETIMAAIAPDDSADRVILSSENFICQAKVALGRDGLYPKIDKSAWLRQCLPTCKSEFALAIRNPASFLPDLLSGASGTPPPDDLLSNGILLDDLRWSDVITRLTDANAGCPVYVWCHEDTPFIWPQVLYTLTQADPSQPLDGALDMVETIMSPDGYDRLSDFIAARGITSEKQRQRAISAFLEAHALEDEIEAEIDLPGWTSDTIETLTDLYEEDVEEITQIPGVTFIAP